jgi:hypothetical protein
MLKLTFAVAVVVSTLIGSQAAFADCPAGYVACGENGQLCCPANP